MDEILKDRLQKIDSRITRQGNLLWASIDDLSKRLAALESASTPLPPVNPPPSPLPTPKETIRADFTNGLDGWNTAGAEIVPQVINGQGKILLTGAQNRSELIFGGNGSGDFNGTIKLLPGATFSYQFSVLVKQIIYGHPGAHNLITQFHTSPDEQAGFGLGLWDYAGDDGHSGGKGLWSAGDTGDHFLAPFSLNVWHDILVKMTIGSAGRSEIYLDGAFVSLRDNVNLLDKGRSFAYIKSGLYRNGAGISGTSELYIDNAIFSTL